MTQHDPGETELNWVSRRQHTGFKTGQIGLVSPCEIGRMVSGKLSSVTQ